LLRNALHASIVLDIDDEFRKVLRIGDGSDLLSFMLIEQRKLGQMLSLCAVAGLEVGQIQSLQSCVVFLSMTLAMRARFHSRSTLDSALYISTVKFCCEEHVHVNLISGHFDGQEWRILVHVTEQSGNVQVQRRTIVQNENSLRLATDCN
jgi:hypothetical protein